MSTQRNDWTDHLPGEGGANDDVEVAGPTRRKPSYPVRAPLPGCLERYRREMELPVTYGRLEGFHESLPLLDSEGRDTLRSGSRTRTDGCRRTAQERRSQTIIRGACANERLNG